MYKVLILSMTLWFTLAEAMIRNNKWIASRRSSDTLWRCSEDLVCKWLYHTQQVGKCCENDFGSWLEMIDPQIKNKRCSNNGPSNLIASLSHSHLQCEKNMKKWKHHENSQGFGIIASLDTRLPKSWRRYFYPSWESLNLWPQEVASMDWSPLWLGGHCCSSTIMCILR